MNRTILATTAIMLLFVTGCDKYHRNRYVGDWDFVTERVFYIDTNSYEFVETKRDTVYYSGKISYGQHENQLIIKFTENDDEIYVYTGTDGDLWLSYPSVYMTCARCPVGSFEEKDKISLKYFYGDKDGIRNLYHVEGAKTKGCKNE